MNGPGVTSTSSDVAGHPTRRWARRSRKRFGANERPLQRGGAALSLRANFSWSLLGKLVYIGTRLGMLVLLTQLGGTEMVGRGMRGFFVCAPFAALGNLGLRNILVTDARNEYRFGDYLRLRMITATVALILTLGTVWALGYRAEAFLIVLVVAIGKLFESISDIFYGLQQRRERMDRESIAMMIRGVAALLFLAVGLYASGSLVVGMIGFPLAMAATFLCWDLPQGLRAWSLSASDDPESGGRCSRQLAGIRRQWDVKTLGSLAWLALPLAVVATEVALFQNVPRYMVEYCLGLSSLGVFAAIGMIVTAGFLLVTAMGLSASPRLAKCFAAGDTGAFWGLLLKLLGLVGCLGAGGVIVIWLFGGPLLGFVFGKPEITKHADLAVWMMIFAAVMYLNGPLGRALDATRQFRTHLAIRTVGVLLALELLPILIVRDGLTGAAAAMIASAACLTGLYVLALVRTVNRISPPEGQSN